MIYVRTKDGRIGKFYQDQSFTITCSLGCIDKKDIVNQADTIEDLCDELVIKYKSEEKPRTVIMSELLKSCKTIKIAFKKHTQWLFENYKDQLELLNLAIWTDKGLIYVAKMNEKGELELI